VPKYHQIYLVLREQLHEGRFAAGVPGEIALMHQLGVARVIVRKALERFLIRRTPGRGTVPLPQPLAAATVDSEAAGERMGSWLENLSSGAPRRRQEGAVVAGAAVPARGCASARGAARLAGAEGAAGASGARGSAIVYHEAKLWVSKTPAAAMQ